MISFYCSEMISYHFTGLIELSNQIDCNNLVGPLGLHVLFKLTPGVKFGGKNCFEVHQRFLVLQLGKQIITCWEPDILFIHWFLMPYRSLARRLARSR